MRTGYLECFSGISGDMLLGALVDAGVPFSLLEETTAALGVGAHLHVRKVTRGGLAATKVDVIAPEPEAVEPTHTHEPHGEQTHALAHAGHEHAHEEHAAHGEHEHGAHSHSHSHQPDHSHEHPHKHTHGAHRSLSTILGIIRAAPLTERVKERSIRAFQLLGEAEAAIHSVPVEEVHFHEVGGVDTIVDIVCAAAGCEALEVDRWVASPLNVGSGTVVCAHGTIPVPAPATLALLGDAPIYAAGPPMERVTPTGAVLLKMLDVQFGPLPRMRVKSTGYGAGGRETPGEPNLLRLLVGEEESGLGDGIGTVGVIETVIDDSSPQLLGYVSELLLAAGAWDVYRAAVQMKKGRTGVQMTVLCHPDLVPALQEMLFRETTTIGLRWRVENKVGLEREFLKVQTTWGKVTIKVARWPSGAVANALPEYEDCRLLAVGHSIPLKQVMQEAMRAYAETAAEAPGQKKEEI